MLKTSAIGTLGKNAETKTIGGKSYAAFSIAVNEKRGQESKTMWINCMKMDESGKLTPCLSKGTKVYVCGKPTLSAYMSKKTNEATADITIWVNELEFCNNPKQEEHKPSNTDNFPSPSSDNDDLPF